VLDGELMAFDGARPDASLLKRPLPKKQFLVSDLLWLEGHGTTTLGYAQRRELLDGLAIAGENWQTPPYFPGGGGFALEAAKAQGLRTVIAKRLDSPYLPGERSRLWREIPVG
jgi:bifunctional non-homologous end joining protein LigD